MHICKINICIYYIYIYIYIYIYNVNWIVTNPGRVLNVYNKFSIIALHCASWDFHPIFGSIQFILNLGNRKYTTLCKTYLNAHGKICVIYYPCQSEQDNVIKVKNI